MKPYVICHMMESVDGRIACDMVDKISGDEYYDALDALECTARVEGKHSYQIHYCGTEEFRPATPSKLTEDSYFVAGHADCYSVSVDTRGTLLWNDTDNAGRLCIVSRLASPDYLEYLRKKSISYIVAGENSIDLHKAMEVLHDAFGVRRVAVVGGGKINGGFLEAGLIDELSLMVAPGIDGRTGQPALFDGAADDAGFLPRKLSLGDVSKFGNGVIWIRYKLV